MPNANKIDIVNAVAARTGLSKKDTAIAVDAALGFIIDAVSHDVNVQVIGFGTFARRSSAARVGRNPKNGEPLTIPAKRKIIFKPGKNFKDACENSTV
jgi:DNA-binding protein HU-beta